jgi:hypothetical protein
MTARSIAGLGDIAAREAHLMEVVAGICGDWIAEQHPSGLRALWADIASSHAWYAQMWSQRFPVVPGRDLSAELASGAATTADLSEQINSLLRAGGDDQSRLRTMTTVVIPATLRRVEAINADLVRDLDRPTAVIIDRIQMDLNRLLYAASQI